ncbi:MAG: hypothetical protein ING08_16550 [Roseomonas sp.]|nr:hypothetical protein [Roseomonas sp.]
MGPLGVVALKVVIEHGLHLLDGLESGAPPLNPEMLVEQRAVEVFKDASRDTLPFVMIVVIRRA